MQPHIENRPKVSFVIHAPPKLKPAVHPSFLQNEVILFQPSFSPLDLDRLFVEIDTGLITHPSQKRGIRTYDTLSCNYLFSRLFSKTIQIDIDSVSITADKKSATEFLLRNKYITPGASLSAAQVSKYVRNVVFMNDQSKKAFDRYCALKL